DTTLLSHVCRLLIEALTAKCRFLNTRAGAFHLTQQVSVAPMRVLDAGLGAIALAFRGRQGLANRLEPGFDLGDALLRHRNGCAKALEAMLSLDDSGVVVRSAADPQPIATDPFAATSDDGLARRQSAATAKSLGERFGGHHIRQRRDHGRGPPHLRCESLYRWVVEGSGRLDQRHASLGKSFQGSRVLIEAIDAHSFQVITQSRFDSTLPTRLDLQ